MKIASAAYSLDQLPDWRAYEAKITAWVTEAAGQGADLLVFPEYGAMELASLAGMKIAGELESSMHFVAGMMGRANALHEGLARKFGVHILASGGPAQGDGPRPVNRSVFFGPTGMLGYQDKQIMIPFERDIMDIRSGDPLAVFDTPIGRIGILICYDSEFPLLGRSLAEAGAELILIPTCTEKIEGHSRVRIGAMARALENQCVTVTSPLVGDAQWCEAVGLSNGAPGVFGPPDLGFPETGILAEGKLNVPGWIYAQVDLRAVGRVRAEGGVQNYRHWPEQLHRIKTVKKV